MDLTSRVALVLQRSVEIPPVPTYHDIDAFYFTVFSWSGARATQEPEAAIRLIGMMLLMVAVVVLTVVEEGVVLFIFVKN